MCEDEGVTTKHSWRKTADTAIGRKRPVAPPSWPPGGRTVVGVWPWPRCRLTGSEDAAETQTTTTTTTVNTAALMKTCDTLPTLSLADLQKQRQVTMSQVKVPPTQQHAVNHVDEGDQQPVVSASL